MSPILKKVLAAVVVKKAYDRVQSARRPQKSFLARVLPTALTVAAIGGGVAYLAKSGRLAPVMQQMKAGGSSGDSPEPVSYRPESHPAGAPVG